MKVFINTPSNFIHDNKHHFSHISYKGFLKQKRSFLDFIKHGVSSSKLHAKLQSPTFINKLYLDKDPDYMLYLNTFKEKYQDFDVIVMNPGLDLVHPEFLYKHFPNSLKCLQFIDDPHLTYSYCLPFSWVFDCAIYCSPSYNENYTMSEILNHVGLKQNKWFPHCITNTEKPKYSIDELKHQLTKRNNKVMYVGNYYTDKSIRLIEIQKHINNEINIYGRHPYFGLIHPILSIINGNFSLKRIKEINDVQRENIYSNYSIGLNMHLSSPARETGNARLYELAYRGIAQVADSGKYSKVSTIFEPEKEILLYENPKECVDQIRRLQNNTDLRISIALAAYKRAINDYSYENVINETCEWFKILIDKKQL